MKIINKAIRLFKNMQFLLLLAVTIISIVVPDILPLIDEIILGYLTFNEARR